MKYIEELVTYKKDIDAIQIAEILWLSQFMGSESSKVEEKPKLTSKIEESIEEELPSIEDEVPESIDNSTPIHENKKQKYGFDKEQDNGSIYTTNIIQKEKFPKIEKQFQSLKVKQNRISKQLLDEIKTADYIATTGYFHPIFSEIKSKESYFSLHIIIDKSESMFLWESYTQHFIKSMKFSTIFTHIHIFELDSSQKEPSVCAINSDHSINLNSAIFREEKSITLIFSDITGDAWKSNRMFEVLDKWSKGSFVTIVSMLPKRMWKKTPLRQGISLFMKPRKFLPKNKDLKAEFNFMGIKSEGKGINIPMLTFDSYSFSHLSNVLMSKKDSWVDSRIFKNLVIKEVAKSKKSNISPKERVKNFFSFALPKTRELAVYCSVLPLNQEIIREVIEKRDLGTEKDVFSEFYFGGLIDKDVEATFGEYAFYEGVAKELRQYISVQEMKILLHQVSEVMSSSFGVDTKKINLLYESADGSKELNDNEKALVELMIEILEDKGKFYEGEVKRLRENFGSIEKENFLEIEEYNIKTSIVKIETLRGYGIGVLINYNIEDGYSTILTTKHLLYNNIGKLLDVRINNENIDLNKIDSFESYDLAICKMKSQLSHTLLNIENKKSKIGENVKIISYHNNKTYIYNGKIINFKKEDSYEITLEYFRETPLSGSAVIDINTNKLIGIVSMSNTRNSNIEAIFIGKVLNLKSSWKLIIKNEQKKLYFKKLQKFLDNEERLGKSIFPNKELWFNALDLTPLDKVKVLILGQDPYPTKGHAHGLCFSALDPIEPLPKSLHNIYKELKSDLNIDNFHTANLEPWAKQGVLLLNSVLTVEEGKANSHKNVGWEEFTDKIINVVNEQCKNVVFVLWGAYAQKKSKFINESKHFIIKDPHPSPLSAYRGFWDSKPFSRINEYLEKNNIEPINWSLKSTIEISSKLNQVLLYKEDNVDIDLNLIVNILNKICTTFSFRVGKEPFVLVDELVSISTSYDKLDSSLLIESKKSLRSILFTEKAYDNYSFFESNNDILRIISFYDWEMLTTLSKNNGAIYFIGWTIILMSEYYSPHYENTGCIYDFLEDKTGIDKNMREPYICQNCLNGISKIKPFSNNDIFNDLKNILKIVGDASKKDLDIFAKGHEIEASVVVQLEKKGWEKSNIIQEYKLPNGHKADLLLRHQDKDLAIIEIKATTNEPKSGLEQAINYGKQLNIDYVYATNGLEIYEYSIDKQKGNFIDKYPSLDELWERYNRPQKRLRDYPYLNKNLRRHHKEAIITITEGIIKGNKRILLSLAMNVGKSVVFLEVLNKLYKSNWFENRKPKVLFLLDKQKERRYIKGVLQEFLDSNIVFLTYNEKYHKYPKDFFDLLIINEVPRLRDGGDKRNEWKEILEYFESSTFISFTTLYDEKMRDYFGEVSYTYSLNDAIHDGILSPYKVEAISIGKLETPLSKILGEDVISSLIDTIVNKIDFKRKIGQTVIICNNLEDMNRIEKGFKKIKLNKYVTVLSTRRQDMLYNIDSFRRGGTYRIAIITKNHLDIGFTHVDNIVLLTPIKSKYKFFNLLSRRVEKRSPFKGNHFTVIDFFSHEHGEYYTPALEEKDNIVIDDLKIFRKKQAQKAEKEKLYREKIEFERKRKVKEAEAWRSIVNRYNIYELEEYIQKYPLSEKLSIAKHQLDILKDKQEKRKLYLSSLSPIERKLEELYEGKQNIPKSTFLFKKIQDGLFDFDKFEALKFLKKMMMNDNKWKEKSTKNRKAHERTLAVIKMLVECSNKDKINIVEDISQNIKDTFRDVDEQILMEEKKKESLDWLRDGRKR